MSRQECANREINNEDCPCVETHCERHGICCECIRFHLHSKEWPKPACWR